MEKPFLFYKDVNGVFNPINLKTDKLLESEGFYIGKILAKGRNIPIYGANHEPVFQKIKQFNAKGQTPVSIIYLELFNIYQKNIIPGEVSRGPEVREN